MFYSENNMCRNEIVEDFKKTLIQSFFKSGKICGIDEITINNACKQVIDQINEGVSLIDLACDNFAKIILSSKVNESYDEKIPTGLELLFSGKGGSKLYRQLTSDSCNTQIALVTNDPFLLDKDLHDLQKSFYPEDYLEAKRFHDIILQHGLISLKEYLSQ